MTPEERHKAVALRVIGECPDRRNPIYPNHAYYRHHYHDRTDIVMICAWCRQTQPPDTK